MAKKTKPAEPAAASSAAGSKSPAGKSPPRKRAKKNETPASSPKVKETKQESSTTPQSVEQREACNRQAVEQAREQMKSGKPGGRPRLFAMDGCSKEFIVTWPTPTGCLASEVKVFADTPQAARNIAEAFNGAPLDAPQDYPFEVEQLTEQAAEKAT